MWRPSRAAAALALGLAATVPIPAAAAQTGGQTAATTIVDFDYRCTIHPGMEAKVVLSG